MADKYNNWLAKILAKKHTTNGLYAITLSKTCTRYSCDEKDVDAPWRAHEDDHKEQIERKGWWTFMSEYLFQLATVGYDKNKFEIESEKEEEKCRQSMK
jgi:hypothetical protein